LSASPTVWYTVAETLRVVLSRWSIAIPVGSAGGPAATTAAEASSGVTTVPVVATGKTCPRSSPLGDTCECTLMYTLPALRSSINAVSIVAVPTVGGDAVWASGAIVSMAGPLAPTEAGPWRWIAVGDVLVWYRCSVSLSATSSMEMAIRPLAAEATVGTSWSPLSDAM
jgi:hypothetical protein